MRKFFSNYLLSIALGILISLCVAWLLGQLNQYLIISDKIALALYIFQMTIILPTIVTIIFINLARLRRIFLINTLKLIIITDLLFIPLYFVSLLSWAKLANHKPEVIFGFNQDALMHSLIFAILFTSVMYLINDALVNK